jgi:hypothetical protein
VTEEEEEEAAEADGSKPTVDAVRTESVNILADLVELSRRGKPTTASTK